MQSSLFQFHTFTFIPSSVLALLWVILQSSAAFEFLIYTDFILRLLLYVIRSHFHIHKLELIIRYEISTMYDSLF
jgi:hypothetical protein